MAGVTDLSFRRVIRHVVGSQHMQRVMLATEMISGRGIMHSHNPHRMQLDHNEQYQVMIQLFGHEPSVMADAARVAADAGAAEINVNMGCPVPKIVRGCDGAALMRQPDLACEIVRQIRQAIQIPLSVKMRLGWDDNNKNAADLARKFEQIGVDRLIIHGRTRSQGYSGQASWSDVATVQAAVSIPVFVNGDIVDRQTAQRALLISGCHGIAVARATIGNPWLIADLAGSEDNTQPTLDDRLQILRMHLDWSVQLHGNIGVQLIKKHLRGYIHGFHDSVTYRTRIATCQNYNDMINAIDSVQEASQNDSTRTSIQSA